VTPVSTFPTGLLGLLGIKSDGQYPSQLGGTYAPTLELSQWLAATNGLDLVSSSTAFNASGDSGMDTQLIVPPGYIWLLKGAAAYAPVGAAEKFIGQVGIFTRRATALYWSQMGSMGGDKVGVTVLGGGSPGTLRSCLGGPLVMMAGDELGFSCQQFVAAAPITVFINAYVFAFHA